MLVQYVLHRLYRGTAVPLLVTLAILGPFNALAQNATSAFPHNYSLVLDNSNVTVIRAHYGPHEKVGVHDHSNYATVYVYLSDSGPVRIDHAEEKPYTITRPPTVRSAFRVAPARPERHSVENLGDTSSDFLRIEVKHAALGIEEPFRGKAPMSLSNPVDSLDFTDHGLQIERILCEPSAPCMVRPAPEDSVIVAFTPFEMSLEAAAHKEKLKTGEVRWLSASRGATITPDFASPAHLLRIFVPAAEK
jgi:hypothetical protein